MGVEISSIHNENLRKAAEQADSGNKNISYNGKLDSSEISAFLKNAEYLNCDYESVCSIIDSYNNIKPESLNNKIKLYEQIDNKKKNIAKLKSELNELPSNGSRDTGTITGAALGAGGAILTLASVTSSINPLVAIGIVGISAIIGGYTGNAIGGGLSSHDAKCVDKQREKLEIQIENREKELAQLRQDFLNLYGTNKPSIIY